MVAPESEIEQKLSAPAKGVAVTMAVHTALADDTVGAGDVRKPTVAGIKGVETEQFV